MASSRAESALLELRQREEAAALHAVQLEGLQKQVGMPGWLQPHGWAGDTRPAWHGWAARLGGVRRRRRCMRCNAAGMPPEAGVLGAQHWLSSHGC